MDEADINQCKVNAQMEQTLISIRLVYGWGRQLV